MSLPIAVYGSHSCEDTALVRDRLLTLKVPFTEHDKEDGARVREILEEYAPGSPRTPTIVFGDGKRVLVEPSLEEFEAALAEAGYPHSPANVVQFDNSLAGRPVPDFALPSTEGGEFVLGGLRGWRRAVLFFAHDHACRVCQGYARQLARCRTEWDEKETRLVMILPDNIERVRYWEDEFAKESEALADSDGQVKQSYSKYFAHVLGSRPEGVITLILDRYTAPRVGSYAPDAGGLVSPHEISSWLQLMDFECDE